MSRRLAVDGGGLKDLYLFDGGTVQGFTWSPNDVTSYASTTISTYLQAEASITIGQVYEGAHASLTINVDVTRYKKIYFQVSTYGSAASITVGGTNVSGGTGTKSLDISGMTGSKTIRLNSGSVSKTTTAGNVSSSIRVTKVWLSNH